MLFFVRGNSLIRKKLLCTVFVLVFISTVSLSQRVEITGPTGSGDFGAVTVVLTNGNYVLADAYYDEGGITDRGAVYLYNGVTHQLISTLKGSKASDRIGYDIEPLTNGNFVVISPDWDNGVVVNAGAVTFCNGTTGLNGFVSSSNSLVGSNTNDKVGYGINDPSAFENVVGLPNGNYVVISHLWNNGSALMAGAVTFCNGSTGLSGLVSVANSLVGSHTNDKVGNNGIKILTNNNYVVSSMQWSGGGASALGAATWCNGASGLTGIVSNLNSFTGSIAIDAIGTITPLANGNYVISSAQCDINGITNSGAVAWGNGTTGLTGSISVSNCLYGTTANDGIGSVYALSNGNYVVASSYFDNGSFIDAGAVTWADGTFASTGPISASNSMLGLKTSDYIGQAGVVALPDGNYLICSDSWDNGVITNAGAVTWANGTIPLTGNITTANSIIGSNPEDKVGSQRAKILTNGNYVIISSSWGGLKGAVTWCDKNIAPVGTVSVSNSLIGLNNNDQLGGVVTALSNGNYVVGCRGWDNGAVLNVGAATWCSGTMPTTGQVNPLNSIIGTTTNDNIGSSIVALNNGNYVLVSSQADIAGLTDAGAVTWCSGVASTTGIVTIANSLVGTTANDKLGNIGIRILPDDTYLVNSAEWDGNNISNIFTTNIGAITFCNGGSSTTGSVTKCNTVRGFSSYTAGNRFSLAYNPVHQYTIISDVFDNIATIYYGSNHSLGKHLDNQNFSISSGVTTELVNNGCRILTTIQSTGAVPVSGLINARVWIESSTPIFNGFPFVARHYQLNPSANPGTATGRITLYFTQQEFTDFNSHANSILNLPENPTDAIGKSNLRIGKYSGTSNDGSGLPASYIGNKSVINPNDNDIVWNSSLSRWEITFDVEGFSGFIVQTEVTVLPLQLLSFTAQKCNSNQVCLTWKTTNEQNVAHFEVERSVHGISFDTIGTIAAKNLTANSYTFTDNNINGNEGKYYYRIKKVDRNGQSEYSKVQLVKLQHNSQISIYPNPVKDIMHMVNWNRIDQLQITDMYGKTVKAWKSISASIVAVSDITTGVYFLQIILKNGERVSYKIIKQ